MSQFDTPYQSIPFSKIKPEHYIPALAENIKNALQKIDNIAQQAAPPSFKNTIYALQNVGELLERNSAILFNLNSAETSEAIQEVTQKASPLLTKFQNDVRLNQTLFERIKIIYENREAENLSVEQLTLLEKEYKGFQNNLPTGKEKDLEILKGLQLYREQFLVTKRTLDELYDITNPQAAEWIRSIKPAFTNPDMEVRLRDEFGIDF